MATTTLSPVVTSIRPNVEVRQDPKKLSRRHRGRILILALGAMVDISIAKASFDLILRGQEMVSWIVAIGITAIAIAGAWQSGSFMRDRKYWAAIVTAIVPLAAAMALFYLRWNGALFGNEAVLYDGVSGSAGGRTAAEEVEAVAMSAVFFATAVLAFFDGYELNTREADALRHAEERHTAARQAVIEAEAEAARVPEEIAKQLVVCDQIDQELEEALQALVALAEETKAWARLEVARVCGDPVVTSAVINVTEEPHRTS